MKKPFSSCISYKWSWKSPHYKLYIYTYMSISKAILFTHVIFQSTPSGPSCRLRTLITTYTSVSRLSLSHFQYCAPIIACYIRGSSKTGNSQKIECVHIYAYLLWMSCVHSTYGIFPIINIIYFISWKWFDNATIKEMHLYCWTNAQRIKWKEWKKKPKWLRKNVTKALR